MNRRLRAAGIQARSFHTGDIVMSYVAGPPNGPPLVFIPGQSVTWEEYTLLLPRLAGRFQVFAVSLRGHGESTWTPGRYTFNRIGADLTAFLEQVVGEPAIVVGNSSGGVLAAWLAANAPHCVTAIVLEDPPLFRCEWPAIKATVAYDTFLAFSRMAVAGGGGLARFLQESARTARASADVLGLKIPPTPVVKVLAWWIALRQAISPGTAIDLKLLPTAPRVLIKGNSQFDGNFSRAFVDGTMGEGFDHAQTLARIAQPVLFLHAKWAMHEGRLLGALDNDDVERARSLVTGPWTYVDMNCGHAIALDVPEREADEIVRWVTSLNRSED